MGKAIDLDKPLSPEDKQYLRERGRGYLIPANERRFGENGDQKPVEWEGAGAAAVSPFYDNAERDKAVYDVGGAPLPNTVLDVNTGRVLDRENGVGVEYTGPGPAPGAYNLAAQRDSEYFDSADDEDDIPDDIVQEVLEYKTENGLKKRLEKEGVQVPDEDPEETKNGLDYKAQLQNRLAVHLDDQRRAENAS